MEWVRDRLCDVRQHLPTVSLAKTTKLISTAPDMSAFRPKGRHQIVGPVLEAVRI